MPCPRQITKGRSPIADTIAPASSRLRINTARGYTGTPPRAKNAAGMSNAPQMGRIAMPARSAATMLAGCK
jgi:hypothetical protein